MKSKHSFFNRICQHAIFRLAATTLVAMAWFSLAICQKINDTEHSDRVKIDLSMNDNPDLVFSKNDKMEMPPHVSTTKYHNEVAKLQFINGANRPIIPDKNNFIK